MREVHVRYVLPGAFFPEEESRLVPDRNPDRDARDAPATAFAFSYYDIVRTESDGVEVTSAPLNPTGRYYIDPEVMTAETLAELPGDYKILTGNMRANGWKFILRCRTGNWQPLREGDSIVRVGS